MNRISLTKQFLLALATLASAVTPIALAKQDLPPEALSAGSFTLARADAEAYAEPSPALTYQQLQVFERGRVAFNKKWVVFPSLGGDWGLGPTFIADKCVACHVGAGRGKMPIKSDEQLFSALVRLSIPGQDDHGGPKPHPNYGDQFQNHGLSGKDTRDHFLGDRAPPEGDVFVDWVEKEVAYADGEKAKLRAPKVRFENLVFGELGADIQTSLRITQPIFGLGFFEAVSEETLLEIAKQQAALGYKGRPNYVWDHLSKQKAIGRFGWKANVPNIRLQIASAFLGDLGVTSQVFIDDNCPPIQKACLAFTPNNRPELINQDWDELELWTLALAVPARRGMDSTEVKRGEKLFEQAQCSVCHVPELKTVSEFKRLPQLANQTFRAYTDLLLHDMGEELSDGRPDYQAGPRDWRTPALWGLGLSQTVTGSTDMLHDGRARNAAEAILWHGGEAQASREAFRNMPKADREALLKFLAAI